MDTFLEFQAAIRDTLLEDPFFQDIPIVTQDKGDIDQMISEALHGAGIATNNASKAGLGILVVTPEGENISERAAVVTLRQSVNLLIVENGPVNRGSTGIQKLPTEVAHRAILKLHNYRTGKGPVALWFSRHSFEVLDGIGQINLEFISERTLQSLPT